MSNDNSTCHRTSGVHAREYVRHMIVGAGVIGQATGEFLEAHNNDVCYYDVDKEVMKKLRTQNKKCVVNLKMNYDLYWICTAEWDVEPVIEKLDKNSCIVIRSTIGPDFIGYAVEKYGIKCIAHIPEFLRQKTALQDIFDNDRVIIGTDSAVMKNLMHEVYCKTSKKVFFCSPVESSLVKLTANAWLAMQISFWNEVETLYASYETVSPQFVADMVTLDNRISKYGSMMVGKPFKGFCFPKDLTAFIKDFEEKEMNPVLLKAVVKVNRQINHRLKKGCVP